MNTTENNELIAEFMGIDQVDIDSWLDTNHNLHYHTYWDWLMPVVEKIESFGYEFIIVESRCYVKHNTDHSMEELFHIELIDSKIKATYQSVVEFIKEYNN